MSSISRKTNNLVKSTTTKYSIRMTYETKDYILERPIISMDTHIIMSMMMVTDSIYCQKLTREVCIYISKIYFLLCSE